MTVEVMQDEALCPPKPPPHKNFKCMFCLSSQELKDWHRPQIQCLVKAGADLVAMETIPSLKEAEALVEVLREFPEAKAWLSFSCKVTDIDGYALTELHTLVMMSNDKFHS